MDWRYNTVWFDQIDSGKFLKQDFKKIPKLDDTFGEVEYAILWHLKSGAKAFDNLPVTNKLSYLELNWANIRDFQSIEKIENLKRLELHYCTKLENDLGLAVLDKTLQHLHIKQSKKFVPTEDLFRLKELKVLCLNACGPIDNLSFLSYFPNLIDFRFVDTNILDGDLKPILDHPTIRSVSFLDKRHYNFKSDNLKNELLLKSTEEYEHYVYKGRFRTFRYDY